MHPFDAPRARLAALAKAHVPENAGEAAGSALLRRGSYRVGSSR